MAITANGLIAKENDNTDFTSKEDWASFKELAIKTKNLIIGRRTYEAYDEDQIWKDVLYVVLTTEPSRKSTKGNVVFNSGGPKAVLEYLEKLGFESALVAGGGTTNAHFLSEKLVDEVYLDVEPTFFSKGIPLIRPVVDLNLKLKLLETKMLSPKTIQLHYLVIK